MLPVLQKWRDEKLVQVSEELECTLPTLAFNDKRLPANVVKASCSTFTQPSPIQAQCWPILLANRDLIGLAETGSGKTLAFVLPGLHQILQRWGGKPPKWQQPMVGRVNLSASSKAWPGIFYDLAHACVAIRLTCFQIPPCIFRCWWWLLLGSSRFSPPRLRRVLRKALV